jgi:small GTP-binding protein
VVNVGLERIRLQLWDTAGAERFRTLIPMYYRGAHIALIVFSLASEQSLEEVAFWAKSVCDAISPPPALLLVGNKSDLVDERAIPFDTGMETAKSIGATYYETSAKTGAHIDDLKDKLGTVGSSAVGQLRKPETARENVTSPEAQTGDCC